VLARRRAEPDVQAVRRRLVVLVGRDGELVPLDDPFVGGGLLGAERVEHERIETRGGSEVGVPEANVIPHACIRTRR
jgi:hypothetical protein